MSFINANPNRCRGIPFVALAMTLTGTAVGQDPCTAPGPGTAQLPDQMPLPGTDQFGMLSDQQFFFPLKSTEALRFESSGNITQITFTGAYYDTNNGTNLPPDSFGQAFQIIVSDSQSPQPQRIPGFRIYDEWHRATAIATGAMLDTPDGLLEEYRYCIDLVRPIFVLPGETLFFSIYNYDAGPFYGSRFLWTWAAPGEGDEESFKGLIREPRDLSIGTNLELMLPTVLSIDCNKLGEPFIIGGSDHSGFQLRTGSLPGPKSFRGVTPGELIPISIHTHAPITITATSDDISAIGLTLLKGPCGSMTEVASWPDINIRGNGTAAVITPESVDPLVAYALLLAAPSLSTVSAVASPEICVATDLADCTVLRTSLTDDITPGIAPICPGIGGGTEDFSLLVYPDTSSLTNVYAVKSVQVGIEYNSDNATPIRVGLNQDFNSFPPNNEIGGANKDLFELCSHFAWVPAGFSGLLNVPCDCGWQINPGDNVAIEVTTHAGLEVGGMLIVGSEATGYAPGVPEAYYRSDACGVGGFAPVSDLGPGFGAPVVNLCLGDIDFTAVNSMGFRFFPETNNTILDPGSMRGKLRVLAEDSQTEKAFRSPMGSAEGIHFVAELSAPLGQNEYLEYQGTLALEEPQCIEFTQWPRYGVWVENPDDTQYDYYLWRDATLSAEALEIQTSVDGVLQDSLTINGVPDGMGGLELADTLWDVVSTDINPGLSSLIVHQYTSDDTPRDLVIVITQDVRPTTINGSPNGAFDADTIRLTLRNVSDEVLRVLSTRFSARSESELVLSDTGLVMDRTALLAKGGAKVDMVGSGSNTSNETKATLTNLVEGSSAVHFIGGYDEPERQFWLDFKVEGTDILGQLTMQSLRDPTTIATTVTTTEDGCLLITPLFAAPTDRFTVTTVQGVPGEFVTVETDPLELTHIKFRGTGLADLCKFARIDNGEIWFLRDNASFDIVHVGGTISGVSNGFILRRVEGNFRKAAGVAPASLDFSLTGVNLEQIEIFDITIITGGPGDVDGDGTVGILDFLKILADWGVCMPPCEADLDGDFQVGIDEFLEVLASWE